MKYLLAIDIGTSGVKLLLFPVEAGQQPVSLTRSYETSCPAPGWAEQNPAHWWQAVCEGLPALLEKACASAEDVCAIGVDGVSWTPVVLDAQGELLANAPLWYDTRATAECAEIREKVGEDAVFAVNGNPVQPYYTLPKLMWMRKHMDHVRDNMRYVLTSNGYIVYKLTGVRSQDMSQGYGWPFYRMGEGTYDEAMADKLGFDLSWIEQPCESSAVVGQVTTDAARQCGLRAGIPVVAGGLDAACGALGIGVIDPGPMHEQSGSAGGMSICVDHYKPAKGLIMGRHVVPGRWLVQGGTVGGGAALEWLLGILNPNGGRSVTAAQASEMAEAVAPGADGLIFLPYMAGERSPVWNPNAKGVFFGLDYSITPGHMARAVMEGAAMALRHNLEAARAAGTQLGTLRAAGGASRSKVWMQAKADITGCPIQAVESGEATACGCAILAGVGTGIFPDFETACNRIVHLEEPYMPREAYKALYDERYQQYLSLYQRLEPMMGG